MGMRVTSSYLEVMREHLLSGKKTVSRSHEESVGVRRSQEEFPNERLCGI